MFSPIWVNLRLEFLVKIPNRATANLDHVAFQAFSLVERKLNGLIDSAGRIMLRTVKPLAAYPTRSKYLMRSCFDAKRIIRSDAVNKINVCRNFTFNCRLARYQTLRFAYLVQPISVHNVNIFVFHAVCSRIQRSTSVCVRSFWPR
jgi:hypothetical protein